MFATGETVGLAEWIIDVTCLVFSLNRNSFSKKPLHLRLKNLFLLVQSSFSTSSWVFRFFSFSYP